MTRGDLPAVVVTAVAATTALAADAEQTWEALLNGTSGITSIEERGAGFELPVTIGGRILEDFDTLKIHLKFYQPIKRWKRNIQDRLYKRESLQVVMDSEYLHC